LNDLKRIAGYCFQKCWSPGESRAALRLSNLIPSGNAQNVISSWATLVAEKVMTIQEAARSHERGRVCVSGISCPLSDFVDRIDS
jgi:hypothetical protein